MIFFPFQLAQPMSTGMIEDVILTIREVAAYLKVTERTIYRLAAAKQIPSFKVGGSWRFSRTDIDNWIQRQTAETIAEKPSK